MPTLIDTVLSAFISPTGAFVHSNVKRSDDMFYWGGEYLDAAKFAHAVAIGTTQSAKTTTLRLAMQDLLPQVKTRRNTRGVLYDPKGDMHLILGAAQYGLDGRVITVNPRLRQSRAWLMYRDIDSNDRAEECAEGFVQKETSKEGGESFFSTTVRNLLKATMCGFMRKNVKWELRDLLLAMVNDDALEALLQPHFDTAKTLNLAMHQRDDTGKDIRSSINNLFNRFNSVAALWDVAARERSGFSISQWSTDNTILVLPGASGDGDPLKVISQVLFDQIAINILRGPEARDVVVDPPRIFVFVDELRRAGYLRRLKDLLFMAASKGARMFLGAQGIEGLRALFGHDEAAELMSLCAIKAMFLTHGSETAEWMSKQVHSQLVREFQTSTNYGGATETYSKSSQRVERPLIESIRFMRLQTPELNRAMEGYFIAPELRSKGREVFWNRIPAARIYDDANGMMWPKSSNDECAEREPEQQNLRPWDRTDLERLQLPAKVLAAQSQQQVRFASISREMFR